MDTLTAPRTIPAGSLTITGGPHPALATATTRPPRPLIVGLSGRLRSGKDTAAQALIGMGFHHGSFARALKDFLYALNPAVAITNDPADGWRRLSSIVDELGWEDAKDYYPEVRALLQRCGTDAGRNVLWDDVWVQAAMNNLPPGDVVFTDVRFPNEALAIRARGGIIIRVERPGLPNSDPHPSETAMDGFDFDATVVNDSTVEALHSRVLFAVLTSARR